MNALKMFRIRQGQLCGTITLPSSKSHTLRAILFGSLAKGRSTIEDYLVSADTDAMIRACRLLGADVQILPGRIEIEGLDGHIESCADVIDAGNSGIVLRFCTAIGALGALPVVVTGDASIRHQRPMAQVLHGLAQLGVKSSSMRGDGYAPVIVQGPLRAGHAEISGEDSQPVSALLIAAALGPGPTEIVVHNPGERPWVALTLDWFTRLGIPCVNCDFRRFFLPGNARYQGFHYRVPGDLSSAAFPVAAALVTDSELRLQNLSMEDSQGDKELIKVFQKMGAHIVVEQNALMVKRGGRLKGVEVDINDFVDGLTVLAVVACFAEGQTRIYNGAIARQKECNRIGSIAQELRKMGADIRETPDGLIVLGKVLHGADLQTYEDHRMAMSLVVAALGAKGESTIAPVGCIAKTFPTFLRDFNGLGAQIT